jgi:hypothetical protein
MMGVPSLHFKHHVELFIFTIFFLQQMIFLFKLLVLNILTSKTQATYDLFHINIFLYYKS